MFSQVCGDSGEFTREQFVRVMVIEYVGTLACTRCRARHSQPGWVFHRYPALRDSSMVGKAPSALRALSDAQLLSENPQLCMLFDAYVNARPLADVWLCLPRWA